MKTSTKLITALSVSLLIASPVWAMSDNASQAGKHSTLAAAHSGVATTKVVSAAVATPLVLVGELGKAAGEAGDSMLGYALEDEVLEISDETVVANPAPRHFNNAQQNSAKKQ